MSSPSLPECDRLRAEMQRIELEIQLSTQRHQPQAVIDQLNIDFLAAFHRSQALGCGATPPPPPFVPRWAPADGLSILMDEGQNAWHAGHVNDVLLLSGGGDAGAILVATDSGGVWVVQQPGSTTSPVARPLSDGWTLPSVDMRCLALGPDGPEHVYAGTVKGLVEANPSSSFPLENWRDIAGTATFDRVNRMVVFPGTRRIVVTGDLGVQWADIPTPGGTYTWHKAIGVPESICSGAALASKDGVVVAFPMLGIFVGHWSNAGLTFQRRPFPRDPTSLFPTEAVMGWTSLASCAADLRRVYAAVALRSNPFTGALMGVFRSENGGGDWTPCNITVKRGSQITPLGQGDGWNNVIAVSPTNPDRVAFGWRSGPFLSDSGGRNPWSMPAQTSDDDGRHQIDVTPHVHSDLHALTFDSVGKRLYIGSDGGVVSTDDLGHTFTSIYNRQLLNLQFRVGCFSADWNTDDLVPGEGLVAGGTQDNGNLFTVIGRNEKGWREIDGGDGGNTLLAYSTSLVRFYNTEVRARSADWNSTARIMTDATALTCKYTDGNGDPQRPGAVVPVKLPKPPLSDTDPCGLQGPMLAPIHDLQFQRNSHSMGAIAAIGQDVYGLFRDSQTQELWWEFLGSIPASKGGISAIASADGTSILIGTTTCLMYRMNAPKFAAQLLPSPTPLVIQPPIGGIVPISLKLAYAFYNAGARILNSPAQGNLLRYDGQSWVSVGGGGQPQASFVTLEADPTTVPPTLFAALADRVIMTDNGGSSWRDASHGLPTHAHCTDLRFAREQDGGHYLYLSTYGRSIWRAPMNRRPFSARGSSRHRRAACLHEFEVIIIGAHRIAVFAEPALLQIAA